jgi:hypothetical protein
MCVAEDWRLTVMDAGTMMPCMLRVGVRCMTMAVVTMGVGMAVLVSRGRGSEQTRVHMDMFAASVHVIERSHLRLDEQPKKAGEGRCNNPARAHKATNAQHVGLTSLRSFLTR